LHLIVVTELFPSEMFLSVTNFADSYGTINSNNLFVNFRWMFTSALRNHMKKRTSHLAGLWIGAAISNTSHSNKAGSTTVKQARLTGKESRSKGLLP
jgi:2-keto-3-deoxy-galactonokinase